MISSKSMRVWFAFVGAMLWTGIFLTGFSSVSWLLYLPAAGFIFSAATGICLSLTAISKLFAFKGNLTGEQTTMIDTHLKNDLK